MRQDVWKCFFVGMLCLWLFWEAIVTKNPMIRIEESILTVQEVETDREVLQREKRENSDWGDLKLYLNKNRHLNIHILWIAKGCILMLFLSVIKRAH